MKKTITSHSGQKEREADAGDASQAYGQASPVPVTGVVDKVPFTAGDSFTGTCASADNSSLMGGSTIMTCVPLGCPTQQMAGFLGTGCW